MLPQCITQHMNPGKVEFVHFFFLYSIPINSSTIKKHHHQGTNVKHTPTDDSFKRQQRKSSFYLDGNFFFFPKHPPALAFQPSLLVWMNQETVMGGEEG